MRNIIVSTLPLVLLAGCETGLGYPDTGPGVALVASNGQSVGTVRTVNSVGGVTFRVDATGLPLGIHGIHVHSVGRCDPPGFESAGPHWNPDGRAHGFENPAGPHRGDLQNVTVAGTGVLSESVAVAGARTDTPRTPGALADADGAALVLHASPDDYRTDPSGNSGARIACAVIVPPAG